MQRNPQNNLPEPLGILVILANFCFGLWNVYSNVRQEKKQAIYGKRQQEIISRLKNIRLESEVQTNEVPVRCETRKGMRNAKHDSSKCNFLHIWQRDWKVTSVREI